ncbi:MAG: phenylacetic acid degradation operon negative regulatory protein PaaX [Burkholderiales bacterium]
MRHAITQRLDDFRAQRRLHAGSLIISLFGDAVLPRGGRIWLGSLIRLLEPLDLNERLVRTAVFRLAKEEWLRTETRGRRADYLLTDTGRRRFAEAARQIYASHAPLWDRRWRLVFFVGEVPAKERDGIRRALAWQGFGTLGPDCCIHPGADLTTALDALVAEGFADQLPMLMPLVAADAQAGVAASASDLVARAWDLGTLGNAYGTFVATYAPVLDDLRAGHGEVSDEEAFLLRLLLIHDYRRLLLRDPELPEVLLPSDWPGGRARQLCRDIYRRVLVPSERHLDHNLTLADESCPPADASLAQRFPEDDPLQAAT